MLEQDKINGYSVISHSQKLFARYQRSEQIEIPFQALFKLPKTFKYSTTFFAWSVSEQATGN